MKIIYPDEKKVKDYFIEVNKEDFYCYLPNHITRIVDVVVVDDIKQFLFPFKRKHFSFCQLKSKAKIKYLKHTRVKVFVMVDKEVLDITACVVKLLELKSSDEDLVIYLDMYTSCRNLYAQICAEMRWEVDYSMFECM